MIPDPGNAADLSRSLAAHEDATKAQQPGQQSSESVVADAAGEVISAVADGAVEVVVEAASAVVSTVLDLFS